MNELVWSCEKPGVWVAGAWRATRTNSHHSWHLYRNGEMMDGRLETLEDCKRYAQNYEDRLHPIVVENYPLAGVTRIEVIDHRPKALLKGRAYVGYDAERVELSFQDELQTLKVFVK
ncbi:hypothetical protein [Mycobacterium intracellulare]|uniref:hypothetical protein n=1 Tax=Mycobacterium intracellulare TaxID=1767 RepID=UPI001929338B|nr:hypothetical protein [Mycobacterium intracellulare]